MQRARKDWRKKKKKIHDWTRKKKKDRKKKKPNHPRLISGRINKQGNLFMRLVLGSCKMSSSRFLHPPVKS